MTNLDKWNFYLQDLESPQIFIDWSYYWMVSAALQRRVWLGDYEHAPVFANLYVLFVMKPGGGKSTAARQGGAKILKTFRYEDQLKIKAGIPRDKCWTDIISFSADDTSKPSLIQQLKETTKTFEIPAVIDPVTGLEVPKRVQHCSLSVLLSEEVTSLFNKANEGIASFLNQCYDAQDYHYKMKHAGEDMVKNVCVNLLGCTTPDNMKMLMGTGILQQGFTARVIPIYAAEPRHRVARYRFDRPGQQESFLEVKNHIEQLTKVRGKLSFSKEAGEFIDYYYEGEKDPLTGKALLEKSPMQKSRMNYDKRTEDYFGRKNLHVQKLAIVKHFSECSDSMEIQLKTVQQAVDILSNDVEPEMHNALASKGRNPLHDVTKSVYDAIVSNGGLTEIQLKIRFLEDVDIERELPSIIKFLGDIGKIKRELRNGKNYLVDAKLNAVKIL